MPWPKPRLVGPLEVSPPGPAPVPAAGSAAARESGRQVAARRSGLRHYAATLLDLLCEQPAASGRQRRERRLVVGLSTASGSMMGLMILRIVPAVFCLLLPAIAFSEEVANSTSEIHYQVSSVPRAQAAASPAWALDTLGAPPEVRLDRLAEETVRAFRSQFGSSWVGPHRRLSEPAITAPYEDGANPGTDVSGEWVVGADGREVWRLSIRSVGARSMRVHFDGFEVDGEVWVHATGVPGTDHWVGPYGDRGLHGDGEFWSESVFAEAVTVAYFPRSGTRPAGRLPFVIPEISHVVAGIPGHGFDPELKPPVLTPRMAVVPGLEPRRAAACLVDVSCDPSWSERWPNPAIALLIIEKARGTFQCTGTAVNVDLQNDEIAVITAGHCISNSRAARNTSFYWGYKSSSCDEAAPALSSLPVTTGSQLLARRIGGWFGDFALLALDRERVLSQTGVTELGWATGEINVGTEVVGISHPAGEPQRIATGSTTDESLSLANNSKYLTVQWDQGTVEPGSSGSGLFLPDGTFVGVLSKGLDIDVCDPAFRSSYHRFSDIYAKIARYIK